MIIPIRSSFVKFFGCDWLMSSNQDETGLSLPKAFDLMIELAWSNLIYLILTWACLTSNESPGLGSIDFRRCFCYVMVLPVMKLWIYQKTFFIKLYCMWVYFFKSNKKSGNTKEQIRIRAFWYFGKLYSKV